MATSVSEELHGDVYPQPSPPPAHLDLDLTRSELLTLDGEGDLFAAIHSQDEERSEEEALEAAEEEEPSKAERQSESHEMFPSAPIPPPVYWGDTESSEYFPHSHTHGDKEADSSHATPSFLTSSSVSGYDQSSLPSSESSATPLSPSFTGIPEDKLEVILAGANEPVSEVVGNRATVEDRGSVVDKLVEDLNENDEAESHERGERDEEFEENDPKEVRSSVLTRSRGENVEEKREAMIRSDDANGSIFIEGEMDREGFERKEEIPVIEALQEVEDEREPDVVDEKEGKEGKERGEGEEEEEEEEEIREGGRGEEEEEEVSGGGGEEEEEGQSEPAHERERISECEVEEGMRELSSHPHQTDFDEVDVQPSHEATNERRWGEIGIDGHDGEEGDEEWKFGKVEEDVDVVPHMEEGRHHIAPESPTHSMEAIVEGDWAVGILISHRSLPLSAVSFSAPSPVAPPDTAISIDTAIREEHEISGKEPVMEAEAKRDKAPTLPSQEAIWDDDHGWDEDDDGDWAVLSAPATRLSPVPSPPKRDEERDEPSGHSLICLVSISLLLFHFGHVVSVCAHHTRR